MPMKHRCKCLHQARSPRACVWAYSTTPFTALKAVVYGFSPGRAGEHARNFLGDWNGKLEMAVPISKTLHDWMLAQRDLVPNGSATVKALDYRRKRWVALTRYLDDGAVPIDNNQVEDTSVGTRTLELVVCRFAAQWQTDCGDHDPNPVDAHEWA